jgi:hypothetical protein
VRRVPARSGLPSLGHLPLPRDARLLQPGAGPAPAPGAAGGDARTG